MNIDSTQPILRIDKRKVFEKATNGVDAFGNDHVATIAHRRVY